jgi:predicted permease
VFVWGSEPVNGQRRDVISGSNFIDLRRRATTLASLAAVHGDDVVVMRDGRPDVQQALQVTVDFLRVLGVQPAIGSDFDDSHRRSGAPPVAIISHAFWRDAFGSEAGAVGRSIEVDGTTTTIVGVLPERFYFAGQWPIYLPLRDDDLAAEDRTHHHYHMVGRLRPGISVNDASHELSSILAAIATEDPRLSRWSVLVEPMHDVTVEAVRQSLWSIAAASLLVLVVAMVNLGTLLRVRTVRRLPELAVRGSLGASRARVASSVALEALLISAGGGVLGVLVAPAALDLFSTIAPPQILIPNSAASIPVLRATLTPDLLGIALTATVALGLLLALPSMWTILRQPPSMMAVRAGHRVTRSAASRWMVGAELALATLLAVGAGLLIRSLTYLTSQDPGVDPTGILTAYFGDVEDRPVAERAEYFRLVLEAVETIPGVRRAGIKDYRPFEGEDDFKGIRFPERPLPRPGEGVREEWRRVSEGYIETVGMRIVSGRAFSPGDFIGTPRSAVINQAFAAKHYPDQDPLGRRLMIAERGYTDVEIVGIATDVRSRGVAVAAPPVVFVPYQASPRGHVALFVKVIGDPMNYAAAIRDAIWSVDSRQPVLPMAPLDEVIARSIAIPTMVSRIVAVMAVVALALAGLGVFGVVAYAVGARRHEFAVRMVLGATAARLTRELIGSVAVLLAVSIVLGLVAAAAGVRGLRAVLHGVTPADPITFAVAAAVVALTGLVACYLPARRVARFDPARTIQHS